MVVHDYTKLVFFHHCLNQTFHASGGRLHWNSGFVHSHIRVLVIRDFLRLRKILIFPNSQINHFPNYIRLDVFHQVPNQRFSVSNKMLSCNVVSFILWVKNLTVQRICEGATKFVPSSYSNSWFSVAKNSFFLSIKVSWKLSHLWRKIRTKTIHYGSCFRILILRMLRKLLLKLNLAETQTFHHRNHERDFFQQRINSTFLQFWWHLLVFFVQGRTC